MSSGASIAPPGRLRSSLVVMPVPVVPAHSTRQRRSDVQAVQESVPAISEEGEDDGEEEEEEEEEEGGEKEEEGEEEGEEGEEEGEEGEEDEGEEGEKGEEEEEAAIAEGRGGSGGKLVMGRVMMVSRVTWRMMRRLVRVRKVARVVIVRMMVRMVGKNTSPSSAPPQLLRIPLPWRLTNVADLLHLGLPQLLMMISPCRVLQIVHPNSMVHHAPLVVNFVVRQLEIF